MSETFSFERGISFRNEGEPERCCIVGLPHVPPQCPIQQDGLSILNIMVLTLTFLGGAQVCHDACVKVRGQLKSAPSFYHVGPRDSSQVLRVDLSSLCPCVSHVI